MTELHICAHILLELHINITLLLTLLMSLGPRAGTVMLVLMSALSAIVVA